MTRRTQMCAAAAALLVLSACNRIADRDSTTVERHAPEASVSFDLEPLPATDGAQQWIASYNSGGKSARFRLDLGPAESIPGNPATKSGEGTVLPEPGSDSTVLLADLQRALGAKAAPHVPQAKTSIPFTYVNLGENLSKAAAGGFSTNPPGDWTAKKLIFGDGDRQSEILLHINANLGKGQFSSVDPRYGDLALTELAKVL